MKPETILLLAIVLTGCGQFQQQKMPQMADVQTGTQGLEIELQPSANNIYMCQQLSIIATLRNLGTHNIENGILTLNYEPMAMKAVSVPENQQFNIAGKTPFNPRGGMDKTGYTLESKTLPANLMNHITPFILTACYPYQTRANFQACVDPDILGTELTKPCTPQDITTSGGQGAPVAVTKIEQKMMMEKDEVRPVFIIHLANQGNGRVIKQDKIKDACEKGVETQMPEVKIEVYLGREKLECQSDTISLTSEDPFVFCKSRKTYPEGGVTFETVLTVKLDYGYVTRESTDITITRLQGQKNCE